MGSLFGGSSPTTTVTNSNKLPAFAEKYGKGLSEASLPAAKQGLTNLQNATPQTYVPGGAQQIAGFNPDQAAAMGQTRNLAQQGNPLLNPALDETQKMISGQYLNSNPYVDDIVGNESQRIQEQMARQFSSAGRYGSPTHSGVTAERVAEATLPFLSQNYENERGRQMQAIGQVGQLGAQRYYDPGVLSALGETQQAQAQQGLDSQFNYQRALGAAQQGIDQSLIQGGTMNPSFFAGQGQQNQTTTQNPGSPSLAGTLLGGALTLGGAYLGGPGGAYAGQQIGSLFG